MDPVYAKKLGVNVDDLLLCQVCNSLLLLSSGTIIL